MLNKILQENGFHVRVSEQELETYPEKVFFLDEKFIRRYYPIAKLPPEHLPGVLALAGQIGRNQGQRVLSWFLYHNFYKKNMEIIRCFPEQLTILGDNSGILYLLLALALIPAYENRAEMENYPLRYAHAAAARIGVMPIRYGLKYPGQFGAMPESLPFMLNFLYRPMFRIGRFDFVLEQAGEYFPLVYENNGQFQLFCRDGWKLTADGELAVPGKKGCRTARFLDNGELAEGTPVNPDTGLAESRVLRISRRDYVNRIYPGDWLLHFHIPASGGMKPDLCMASFQEAFLFFRNHFPDRPVKLIFTNSWIGNPLWVERLPDSNLARLIRSSLLFPSISEPDAGLTFVFARTDPDYDSYPQETDLQRIMINQLKTGGKLRSVGMLIRPDMYGLKSAGENFQPHNYQRDLSFGQSQTE